MATKYVNIPLFPDKFFSYSISLEDNSYILEFLYVERVGLYLMSLFDSDKSPIVRSMGVVPGYPISRSYYLPNLSGYFLLASKSGEPSEAYKEYPTKINEYYDMFYVYED